MITGYFCLFLALVALPGILVWILMQDRETLDEPEFKAMYGRAYTELKLESFWTKSFYLMYIIRRSIFLRIAFYGEAHQAIQVIALMFLNMFIILYQGKNRPLKYQLDNKIELLNEFIVSICTMHLMFFTPVVSDLKLQY